MKSKKITVRFPQTLRAAMHTAMMQSGYGAHAKSRWIIEAMHGLLLQENLLDFVENGIDIHQSDLFNIEAFYLDPLTEQKLKLALVKIRKEQPLFEGVQSAFIRACVIYRLLFPKKFPQGEFLINTLNNI